MVIIALRVDVPFIVALLDAFVDPCTTLEGAFESRC